MTDMVADQMPMLCEPSLGDVGGKSEMGGMEPKKSLLLVVVCKMDMVGRFVMSRRTDCASRSAEMPPA
jgi:hypothetical protein